MILQVKLTYYNSGEQTEIFDTDIDQVSPSSGQTDGLSAGGCRQHAGIYFLRYLDS